MNTKFFGLASASFLSAVAACSACSSSSGGGGAPAQGGSSAGDEAQAGTVSQAGSSAQSGAGAPGGGSSGAGAGGASSGGTAGSAGAVAQAGGGATDKCGVALLCDDFEKYDLAKPPSAPWTSNASGGTVTIDGTHVHSGTHAVKISAAAASGYRSAMINLQKTTFLPTADDVFYGRMMFWLDSAPQTSVHWTFIDAQGKVPNQAYHSIYRYGGQVPIMNGNTFVGSKLMANYDTPDSYATPAVGPSTDCWLHSDDIPVPVGAWTCAEWKFDGQGNKMQFWLDGSEVTSLEMNGMGQGCVNQTSPYTWLAPSFDRIDLGWESYQADDARNIWLDDVAIGTERMGCPE